MLAAHGAHVFLLVNSKPYTADEAGDWWREVAKYSDFVREVYFPAPLISKQGPMLGNRTMRNAFRDGVLELTSAGIPVTKVGLFLGFQTERGQRRPRRAGAACLVPDDQMAGARREAGRG